MAQAAAEAVVHSARMPAREAPGRWLQELEIPLPVATVVRLAELAIQVERGRLVVGACHFSHAAQILDAALVAQSQALDLRSVAVRRVAEPHVAEVLAAGRQVASVVRRDHE